MGKKIKLIRFIQLWGIVFLFVSGGSIVAIDIIVSYRGFHARAEQMRSEYIVQQKEMIKQEVDRVVAMINHEKARSETITKKKIKSRTYEAYSIAQNIYQQNKTTKSKPEIKQMIMDALRPIRFADGTGYYFATRLDGFEILFADKPELEGLNLLDMQDTHGQYVIREMIGIVQQSGEGFYEYHWTKPNVIGKDFKKISFVKRFKPFDWFIGTGLYVDDVEASIKTRLMEQINKIRFGVNGYIFVDTWQGIALAHGIQPNLIGTNMWETEDCKGNKTTQMLVAAAKKEEGGYISYWWRKSSTVKESPKLAYAKGVPDWKILVGTGVYLDDIEKDIIVIQTKLNDEIKTKIFSFALIVIVLIVFTLLAFNHLNHKLKNDFNLFISFFNRAAYSNKKIDREVIKFAELDRMAEYANKMLMDRKQMEESLRESKGKLIEAQQLAKIGDFTWDVISGSVTWSEGMYDLLKYDKDTKIDLAKVKNAIYHPDDLKEVTRWLNDCLASGREKLTPKEYRLIRKDEKVLEVHTEGNITYQDGKAITVFGMCQDITERKQIEKEIHKFKMISDQANHGIAIADLEGNCEYVNDCFAKAHGYTSEELTGQNLAVFHNEKQMEKVNRINELIVKQGDYSLLEVWHTHKDGTEFPMLMNSIVIKDKNAVPQYIATTAIDISVQKKLESQLQQSQKMESIGTLAGGIAHDFNNILFPIVGHTEMLIEDIPEDSPFRASLDQIYTAALRASDLVKQILIFSRQDNSELKLIKIQSIIEEALKLIRSTIPTTIKIKQSIQTDCGVIKADPTQIHQIVMNLATNAYHAMGETGGELNLNLKEIKFGEYDVISPEMSPGIYACLTIADTGKGMDKDLTQKIFDPFFTTKEKGKGTGMGLPVVHGIVTGMRGVIQVYSEPDKGTEFRVYLPVVDRFSEQQVTQTKELLQIGTEKILLIDDEEAILKMEKVMLERLGYQVTIRISSIEALEAFRDSPDKFDLVITDMAMPTMPGDKLSAELTKIRSDIPVLLCTGFSETMSEEKAASLGIKGFLLKPIVIKDLSQKIRDVLDKK